MGSSAPVAQRRAFAQSLERSPDVAPGNDEIATMRWPPEPVTNPARGVPSVRDNITSDQNAGKQSTDRAAPREVALEATVAEPEHSAGRVLERSVR